MILPIRTDSPLRSTPWMNWAILLVMLGVGIAEGLTDQFQHATWVTHFQLSGRVPFLPTFITYAFVHGGWLPPLGKKLALFIFWDKINEPLGAGGGFFFFTSGGGAAGGGFFFVGSARA